MSLKLDTLMPPKVLADPAQAAAILLSAILLRVNFIPGVRSRLGWRGMRECPHHPGALTARIATMPGVYGVMRQEPQSETNTGQAEYLLTYFPTAEDELIESFSIDACLASMQDDYTDRLRDFPGHPDLCNLFAVAQLSVSLSVDHSIALTLHTPDRAVIVAQDGITVQTPEGPYQAVTPGAPDQDLPAFEIAMAFVHALAASMTYALGAAPTQMQQTTQPGTVRSYSKRGVQSRLAPNIKDLHLSFGWGAEPLMPEPDTTADLELAWHTPDPKPQPYADALWWETGMQGARHSLDMSQLGISDKPKLIVLTGFLGAGKTSFLGHFIESQVSRNGFVAVIQNEMGAKGLDNDLLDQHYAAVEMDDGCVCCTLAGSLKIAMADILRNYQPDYVVLETTGVANPANLLAEIADLEDQLEFMSITTIVDASLGLATLERFEVARDQVRLADTLLLNKVDETAADDRTKLEAAIRELNPVVQIHATNHGDIAATTLYGIEGAPKRKPTSHRNPKRRQHHHHTHEHAHPHGHDHGHHHHHHDHTDDHISSKIWSPDMPLNKDRYIEAVAALPPGVLRLKGIIDLEGSTDPMLSQYVPGMHRLTPAGSADTGERYLIFIGENIDAAVHDFHHAATRP